MFMFIFFGGIFVVAGLLIINSSKIDPSWERVNGTIIDVSRTTGKNSSSTYAPVVEYSVNSQVYSVVGSISTSSQPNIGQSREVAYDAARPAQSKVVESASSLWFVYIFPVVGLFLMVLGVHLYARSKKRNNNIEHLMQNGQKLQGVLVDVLSEGGNTAGGYKLVVAATAASGIVQNYTSDALTGIGGLAMADFHSNPVPIDVYVDQLNPQNFYVDISDVPALTPERIKQLITLSGHNLSKDVSVHSDTFSDKK